MIIRTTAACAVLAAIAISASFAQAQSADARRRAAVRKFTDLVSRHPMADVSQGMVAMTVRDHLVLDFVDGDNRLARMNQAAAVGYFDRPGCGLCPVLSISVPYLLDRRAGDDAIMLVLWHEYQHIVAIEEGRRPPTLHMPLRIGEPVSAALVELLVEEELQVYEAEYRLAAFLGWQPNDAYFHAYHDHGRAAMACMLIEEYVTLPLYKGHDATLAKVVERFVNEEP